MLAGGVRQDEPHSVIYITVIVIENRIAYFAGYIAV
jgi:hypothetical protein